MNNTEIKHLNTALKGEHMAIDSFDNFIFDTKNDVTKSKLMEVQKHHKNQAIRIAERIQELGGNPVNSSGLTGVIADIEHKIFPSRYYKGDILNSAIEGEKLGINAFKKIINNLNEEKNIELINDIMNKNELLLEELINFQS